MHSLYIFSFKNFIIKILIFIVLTVFCFSIVLEFYNPLTINNESVIVYNNNVIPELPKNITVSYNNLGYVGEHYSDTITRMKICYVGSSKTQSIYIPVSSQWSTKSLQNQRGYWFNNCGKDGATINIWINEIEKLKKINPQFVVVLLDPFDGQNIELMSADTSFLLRSQLFSTVLLPIYRIAKNKLWGTEIGHKKVSWKNEELVNKVSPPSEHIALEADKIVNSLNQLSAAIRRINAQPIFVSCPTPFGDYTNSDGIEMKRVKESINTDLFYKNFAYILNSYCRENKVFYINGYSLEKNTDFFYDYGHFSVSGSAAFGGLIKPQLDSIINDCNSKK